ncbi:MAG: M23 family metallopeptidase [Desulfuromonadaceae bacterium]|nr:M23 family metallopeptidase [Desulfuromonadaceae bacterium]
MKGIKKLFSIALLGALAFGAYMYFHDRRGPELSFSPAEGYITRSTLLHLKLQDKSGLKHARVTLSQGENEFTLLNKEYPVATTSVHEALELDPHLQDGPVEISITTTDRAYYNFGKGNSTEATYTLTRDTRAPMLSVTSKAHNLNYGGAGLIVYTSSEPLVESGIRIGGRFFPGYEQPDGTYLCLFSFPYDADPDAIPRLEGTDMAGNIGNGGFYYHLNRRRFVTDTINIDDRFLNSKMPQFEHMFPKAQTPLDIFLKVNRELRPQNRAWLEEIGNKTQTFPTWNKAFIRQPNTATRATFGDQRKYIYAGKTIDAQTHLGVDLASVAQDQIQAANAGTVVFTDFVGIYGNCVIIDHGLGLQSLYAHLSNINVSVGQKVERGEIIGNSGATGLAGGDHLHFGMVISGTPVNPIEWWDQNWVTNNINSKLPAR